MAVSAAFKLVLLGGRAELHRLREIGSERQLFDVGADLVETKLRLRGVDRIAHFAFVKAERRVGEQRRA